MTHSQTDSEALEIGFRSTLWVRNLTKNQTRYGWQSERSTAALHVAGSIPARTKYLSDLHLPVPGLAVCVCEFECL